jgi:hypothetical protein
MPETVTLNTASTLRMLDHLERGRGFGVTADEWPNPPDPVKVRQHCRQIAAAAAVAAIGLTQDAAGLELQIRALAGASVGDEKLTTFAACLPLVESPQGGQWQAADLVALAAASLNLSLVKCPTDHDAGKPRDCTGQKLALDRGFIMLRAAIALLAEFRRQHPKPPAELPETLSARVTVLCELECDHADPECVAEIIVDAESLGKLTIRNCEATEAA